MRLNAHLFVGVVAITLGLVMICRVHPVNAEIVQHSSELQKNTRVAQCVFSNRLVGKLYDFGVEQDKKFGLMNGCKSKYLVRPIQVAIHVPIDMPDGKSYPIAGVWQIRYVFERCGEGKVYNAVFVANAGGEEPNAQPMYPGTTIADIRLVKDALFSALFAATQKAQSGPKKCEDIAVFDMRQAEPDKGGALPGNRPGAVWREVWTLWYCGELIDVPMTFQTDADGKGTTFTAGTK